MYKSNTANVSSVKIRQVDTSKPETLALLQWLQLKILPSDVPEDTSNGFWWIAYDVELPVGFASVRRSTSFTQTGYLSRAGVIYSHRGQGLQSRFIRVRQAKAVSLGWTHLITDTLNNPASANSLIRCGFKSYLPRKPWAADGAAYWIKRISETKPKE
jgi:hypothetical protein